MSMREEKRVNSSRDQNEGTYRSGEGTLCGPGSELRTRGNWKSRAENIHGMGKQIMYKAYIA